MSNTENTASPQAIRSLKYWSPGPYSVVIHERYGTEAITTIAYEGLAECLDSGLLRHCYPADVYRPTCVGDTVLDHLRSVRQ